MLRTDNGGEFTSREFSDYCATHGIQRQFSQPYTPQHNGVAERKNRTLLDIVRCFLAEGDLAGHLWAEAVRAACIITNLRPSKMSPDKTPDELFSGKKPNVSKLRIFGSLVYVHKTGPSKSKLDVRSRPCYHLSFDDRTKGYRCFDPLQKKVIISKDVRFLEKSPPIPESRADIEEPPQLISGPALPNYMPSQNSQPASTLDSSVCLPTSPASSAPAMPSLQTSSDSTSLESPRSASPEPANSPTPPIVIQPAVPGPTQDSRSSTLHPQPRRSTHHRSAPKSHNDFIPFSYLDNFIGIVEEGGESISFSQACLNPRWLQAMIAEYRSITKNETWTLVPLPPNVRPITAKWIFKIKPGIARGPDLYKARIVARGNEQVHGINFQETFAPTVRWESIRLIIALAAHHGWPIFQLDVVTAFLNGHLTDDVYMLQPPGCAKPGYERLVRKLNRSLYGLRQSPRAWYARIDVYLRRHGLQRTHADSNVYFYRRNTTIIILVLYVDDLLITGSDPAQLSNLKTDLSLEFEMKDLGLMRKFLGVQVLQTTQGILLHQTDYAKTILSTFSQPTDFPTYIPLTANIQLSKDTRTPKTDARTYQGLVGQLLYLTKTRPDIGYATSLSSRFMHSPQVRHRQAAQHIIRYLQKFPSLGLWYARGATDTLVGYFDADYAGNPDDRTSTSAYLFTLGDAPISWCSKKQSSTARSSCESEYRALARCTCEAVWLRQLLLELGFATSQPTSLWCDN
jgi:hypothetical protein